MEGCSSITADSVRTHERDMAAAGVVAVNPRAATEAAASIVMLSTTTIEIGEVTQMWNRQFMVWGKVTIQMFFMTGPLLRDTSLPKQASLLCLGR